MAMQYQKLPKKKRDRSLALFQTTNDETGRLAHKLSLFARESSDADEAVTKVCNINVAGRPHLEVRHKKREHCL